MSKKDIMKKFGFGSEVFNFYLKMKLIWKVKRKKDEFEYDSRLESYILEKGSVFNHCFSDNFRDHIRDFVNVTKYTGPVKVYSKEEIELYARKKQQEEKKKQPK